MISQSRDFIRLPSKVVFTLVPKMSVSENIRPIAMFVIVIVAAATAAVAVNDTNQKNVRCHNPFIDQETGEVFEGRMNYTTYAYGKFKLVSWFYQEPFKSCLPLYSIGGVHYHRGNFDLPKTKKECEDLCAEPCTMENGSPGICMSETFCELKNKHTFRPRPCHAYNVKCCPRDFVSANPIPTISEITVNVKDQKPGTEGPRRRPQSRRSQLDYI